MRKNEPELKAFVNAALRKLKDEKFYSKIVPNFVTDPIVDAGDDQVLRDRSSGDELRRARPAPADGSSSRSARRQPRHDSSEKGGL